MKMYTRGGYKSYKNYKGLLNVIYFLSINGEERVRSPYRISYVILFIRDKGFVIKAIKVIASRSDIFNIKILISLRFVTARCMFILFHMNTKKPAQAILVKSHKFLINKTYLLKKNNVFKYVFNFDNSQKLL